MEKMITLFPVAMEEEYIIINPEQKTSLSS